MKFLNPQTLRENLIICSLYLAAWEILENSVVKQLRDFYQIGFDENEETVSEAYKTRVLCRHKSPFRASLLWLQESGVVDQADLDLADKLREHRNEIGHKLPQFIATAEHDVDVELFTKLVDLVVKIDRWWIINVELDCLELDVEIDEQEVESGNMLFLRLMLSIVAGDETSGQFFDEFQKLWNRKKREGTL